MTQQKSLSWPEIVQATFVPPDLTGLSLAEALTAVGLAFEQCLAESPSVQEYLAAEPKGPGTNCPDSPVAELAKFLAYRRGEVDQSDARVWAKFLDCYMRPVFLERRAIVLATAHGSGEPRETREFLQAASLVALSCDRLYLAWLRRMVIPFQDLSPADQEAFRRRWTGKLWTYDYTVYDHASPDLADRRAWASAFPLETLQMIKDLRTLKSCALRLPTPELEIVAYLDDLILAYAETAVGCLEASWANVDEAWIRIPATSRFVPVHGMENYEHPFGVSPEFRLEQRVTTEAQAAEISAFRQGTQKRLDAYGLPEEVRAAALGKLATLDVGIFQTVIAGGICLGHRTMGQVVPNRQDILARGGKVLIADPTEDQPYIDILKSLVRKNCQPAAVETICAYLSTWEHMRQVLGHEHFHPVGCTPDTQALLGKIYDLLEESKATIGGLLVARDLDDSLESQRWLAAGSIARLLRFMHKTHLEDASVAPYVRENLVILSTLLDSGVLTFTEGQGLSINFSEDNLGRWFISLELFTLQVVMAYQAGDTGGLRILRQNLCGLDDRGDDETSQAVIAWVNRS